MPEEKSCVYESCMATPPIFRKLVSSMLQMKPMVPNTRMGGNATTGSMPSLLKALYATELAIAMVGMKKATLML